MHEYANSLLDAEGKTYANTHLKASSSHKFMTTVMDSGTWSDKISALTLVVQESPIHTRKELESLLGMAGKRSRDNALMALAAIKDLLAQGVLLPANRKLRHFNKQPELLAALLGTKSYWSPKDPLPGGLTKQHLIMWTYEDWLKQSYFEMLQVLETWCNDTVENSRMRAVTYVFELLKEKPEQEENLLRLLVNKLGDTAKKIASRASYLILQLQDSHPQMRAVIVASIESEVLLKPGQTSTAKYYAAITLNQTVLRTAEPQTASKLLDAYFGVFVAILNKSKQKEIAAEPESGKDSKKRKRKTHKASAGVDQAETELDDKIIAQVLTGIHRAFPYCKSESAKFEEHIDTMFRITHSANFNTSIQALQLLQQISSSLNMSNDRFMRTLYESLLDPRLVHSSKQTMYLNLLYRSLKADASMRRVKAFVKRLTQVLNLHEPPFICAALYLIHELESVLPGLQTMYTQPEMNDDDDEEVYHDAPDSDSDEARTRVASTKPTSIARSKTAYDPRKRDPDFSNADGACLWELPPWLRHYHPSITLFARSLLHPTPASFAPSKKKSAQQQQQPAAFPPKPDPTAHTLMHFLDRFAYRNPKQPSESKPGRGTSIMQPAFGSAGATDTLFTRSRLGDMLPFPSATSVASFGASAAGAGQPTANSEAFWARQASQVPAEDVFFHRYFSEVGPRRKAAAARREGKAGDATDDDEGEGKKKGKKAADEGDSDWDSEVGAGEDEIWRALVGSRPEIEEGQDDVESEEEDFDEADFAAEMQDSDDDDGGDDDGVELNLDSDDEDDAGVFDEEGLGEGPEDEDDDGSALDLEAGESDAMFSSEEEEEEQPSSKKHKANADADGKKGKKKQRLSSMPTFASADDYARMIDEAEDGDGLDEG